MDTPKWNAADRAGSFKHWINALLEEARIQFLRAGTHIEIFFIFGDDGLMEVVPVAGMDKAEMVGALRQMLRERDGYAYIHLVEAAATRQEEAAGADTLLLIAESREGLSEGWFNTVVTRGDEKLLMDAVRVDGTKMEGRLVGMFTER